MILADRSRAPEIMDGEEFTPAELVRNLRDLELYNRMPGGIAAILQSLDGLTRGLRPSGRLSILDVGAGAGDVAGRVASWAKGRGWRPRVVASDLNPRMIEVARSREGRNGGVRLCVADARSLPHGDAEFDLAYSSLVFHHLDEPEIEKVLSEMRRVTRLGFVVADLRRSVLAFSSVWALTRLTSRNRLTLNDGPLSVRRALTPGEMRFLAKRAGLGVPAVRRRGPARMILAYRHGAGGASA